MRKIRNLIIHPLFSGSFIMIVGSNLTNFIAYIYHLVMGRLLGPAQYGILAATISLIGLFSVTFSFLGLVIVKFVSASEGNKLDAILSWFNKKAILGGLALVILALVLSPAISGFLNIKLSIIFLIAPILLVNLISYVYKSFLQGLLKFKETVISSALEYLLRLGFGLGFVYLGFSVLGATVGILAAAIVGLLVSFYFLKNHKLFLQKVELPEKQRVFAYALPIFVVSFANNSLISSDLLLVKHFFDAHSAGLYAAMSNLGKIIFYGAAPVGSVMFPLISQRHAQGKDYKKIFIYSTLLTAAIVLGVLTIYWLFPDFAIRVLYGTKYLEIDKNLLLFGITMAVYTFASLLVSYFLSKEKTLPAYAVLAAAVLQLVGIWAYHSTIVAVITVSLVVISLLLAFLLIYFAYEARNQG